MMSRWLRFNLYFGLALALGLALGTGCRSVDGQGKKLLSSLRIYLEVPPGSHATGELIPVYREHPIMLRVKKEPFLTETHIKSAKVVNVIGGFALSIQFNQEGTWLFEQYTASNRGRRFVVAGRWMTPPDKKVGPARWLAAPQLNQTISDGQFVFTPDATREETERLAQGLNNLAKKIGSDDSW